MLGCGRVRAAKMPPQGRKACAEKAAARWEKKWETGVTVFAVGPGGATPPAWLAITFGGAGILYIAYRLYKEWAGVTTWYDLVGAFFAIIMAGWLLLWGLGLVGGM
jgi:hypothetical protein